MSRASLRPGVARGFYPERAAPSDGWLDRPVQRLRCAVARPLQRLSSPRRHFLDAVHAHGRALEAMCETELARQIETLRRDLLRRGLADDVVPRAFATIREVSRRTAGCAHYDVQLLAGRAMVRGWLAEMATGEGKTLAATLPAATAALAGIPVHVISANDYLVERDAEAMGPVYRALGLSVGAVTERLSTHEGRQAAYACDVTYVTGKQVAFDYLKDRLAWPQRRQSLAAPIAGLRGDPAPGRLLLRGLCFAIIDEADSVLIDEARTPLILSGATEAPDQHALARQAMRLARALQDTDVRVQPSTQTVELTASGRQRLAALAAPLTGLWMRPERREEWVERALCALHLFVRDRHYLVRDGRIEIIDQPTGRAAPDRAWERGLHQLIEMKEGCEPSREMATLARISHQQFFRRYLRLSGMTGTAREVASELGAVYGLGFTAIPTRLPLQRCSWGTRLFATCDAQLDAVAERVREIQRTGRPVLIGTASVEASERLGRRLAERGLPHCVLNARQDRHEAAIVADAGRRGRITVATQMAGRGTDIQLGPGVAEAGGLHVIATQRGEARRIDRQLFGRCGRQGDPGSIEEIFSLEDDRLTAFLPVGVVRFLAARCAGSSPLHGLAAKLLTGLPQWAEERRHARARRSLLAMDESLGRLLAFSGSGE